MLGHEFSGLAYAVLTLDLDQISLGQLDIRVSWSWNGRETWERAIDLLDRGGTSIRSSPTTTGWMGGRRPLLACGPDRMSRRWFTPIGATGRAGKRLAHRETGTRRDAE